MYIIGIAGGTASGKTTFVNRLKTRFSNEQINIISQDDYYKPLSHLSIQEREQTNFDHPKSIDFNLLHTHIISLKNNETIEVPCYCFSSHDRLNETKLISSKKILIIEGILILSQPEIKNICDYTIFIDAPHEIRLNRRLERDIKERGRTKESVYKQFNDHIVPMHNMYVAPVKDNVNMVINGTEDMTTNLNKISELIIKHL